MKIMSKANRTQISLILANHQRQRPMMQQRRKANIEKEQTLQQTPVGKLSLRLGHRILKMRINPRGENVGVLHHTMFCKRPEARGQDGVGRIYNESDNKSNK
jgi:hypothetical protein